MRPGWSVTGILLAAILGLAGCRRPADEGTGSNTAPVSPGAITNYLVTGLIRELRPDGTNVVIKHDEIPGFMGAMTMNFDVTNALILQGLKTNDLVKFQYHVTGEDSWADGFQVVGNAGPVAVPETEVVLNDPSAVSFFKAVPTLAVGDELPNYVLTNQLGKAFQLSDYRGKVLALNFLFTRCPMPEFCPRFATRFRSIQNTLLERKDAPTDWRLLTVTIDPLYDTPRVLRAYARRYDADFTRWTFATGPYEQIEPLGAHFGVEFAIKVTPDRLTHKGRAVVIDRRGRVHAIFTGNEWTSDEVVQAILEAAAKK